VATGRLAVVLDRAVMAARHGRDLVVLAGAGVAWRTLLFTLSGSVNAVQTAWRGILEHEPSPHEGLAATNRAFTSRS